MKLRSATQERTSAPVANTPSKPTVTNCSGKVYHCCEIHGFKVNYEPDVFETTPHLEISFKLDLSKAAKLLPATVLRKLQLSTFVWLNKANNDPVTSAAIYYFKGSAKAVEKEGSIEILSAELYLNSRQNWGDGGVIVHELSHALHDKLCPDGFGNREILEVSNCTALHSEIPHQLLLYCILGLQCGHVKESL